MTFLNFVAAPVLDNGGAEFNVKHPAYGAAGNGVQVNAGSNGATVSGSTFSHGSLQIGTWYVTIPFAGQVQQTILTASNPSGNIVRLALSTGTASSTQPFYPAFGLSGDWVYGSVGMDINGKPIGGGFGQPITLSGGIVTNSSGTIGVSQVITSGPGNTGIQQGTPSQWIQFVNSGTPTIGSVTGSTVTGPATLTTMLTCVTAGTGTLSTSASYNLTGCAAVWAPADDAAFHAAALACQAAGGGVVKVPNGIYGMSTQVVVPWGPAVHFVGESRQGVKIVNVAPSGASPMILHQCPGSVQHMTFDLAFTASGGHAFQASYAQSGSTSNATCNTQTVTFAYTGGTPTAMTITDGVNTATLSAPTSNWNTTAITTALTGATIDATCTAVTGTGGTGSTFTLAWKTTGDPFLVPAQFGQAGATGVTFSTVTSPTLTTASPQTIPTTDIINLQGAGTSVNGSGTPPFLTSVSSGWSSGPPISTFTLATPPPLALVAGTVNWGSGPQVLDEIFQYDIGLCHGNYGMQSFATNVTDSSSPPGNPFPNILHYWYDHMYLYEYPQIEQEPINYLCCHKVSRGNVFCNDFQGRGPSNGFSFDYEQSFGATYTQFSSAGGGANTDVGNWGPNGNGTAVLNQTTPFVVTDPAGVAGTIGTTPLFNVNCSDATIAGLSLPAKVPYLARGTNAAATHRISASRLLGGFQGNTAGTFNLTGTDVGNDGTAPFHFQGAAATSITGTYNTAQTIALSGTASHLGNVVIGMGVSDVTNPSKITPGATVTGITGNVIQISGLVTSTMAGDTLAFTYPVVINMTGGTLNCATLPLIGVPSGTGIAAMYNVTLNLSGVTVIGYSSDTNLTLGSLTKNITGCSGITNSTKTYRRSYTFNVPGAVTAATLGPFFWQGATGQTGTIVGASYILSTGTATVAVNQNGSSVSSLSALSVTSSAAHTSCATPPPLSGSSNSGAGDEITIVVSSPGSSPAGLAVTVFVEDTN